VILVAMIERVSERLERTAMGQFRVVRLDEISTSITGFATIPGMAVDPT
jgi:hypothetical protein